MGVKAVLAALGVAAFAAVGPCRGAEATVTLTKPPVLSKDVDAAPKIERPRNAAERRINKALAAYDASSLEKLKECRENAGVADFEWSRSFWQTMRGPRYLSFSVSTYYGSCGGAHPSSVMSSIIFDLTTGARADWTQLLPAKLVGKLSGDRGGASEMPSLSSKRLRELYLDAYRKGDHADDKECLEAVETAGSGAPSFQAWLDAARGGLATIILLPHVDGACMDDLVLPEAVLRAEGAPEATLRAIAAAHATWKPDSDAK